MPNVSDRSWTAGTLAIVRASVVQFVAVLIALLPVPLLARTIDVLTTPSGIQLWLVSEPSIPLIAIRFSFAGGSVRDPDGKAGLSAMTAALLTEGAAGFDSAAFSRQLAEEGADIGFSASRDQIYGSLDVIASRLAPAIELLRQAVTAPRFDPDAVERVRRQLRADVDRASGDPRTIAFHRWYSESFPNHPYGRPVNGEAKSLAAIARDDVVAAHRKLLVRGGLKVVIVGAIDRAGAMALVERVFGELPQGTAADPLPALHMNALAGPVRVSADQPLATAAFGTAALAVTDPDYPALVVLRQIVGSGDFDSTLMEEIRVKRGLAYAVSLTLINDSTAGILLGGMSTKNENMDAALTTLREVLGRVASEGPTTAAFDNAKRYLTGSYLLDLDTDAKLAGSLLQLWIDGREPGFIDARNAQIESVMLADVRRIATRVFDPARLNTVVVGRFGTAR